MKRLSAAVIALWMAALLPLSAQLGMGNGRVMGVIQDESGRRLAGAQVKVTHLEYKNELTAVSDAKGRWQVSGIAGGRYGIVVSLAGYQNAQVDLTVSLATKLTHTLEITLKKGDANAVTFEPKAESVALARLLQDGNQLYAEGQFADARAKFESFLADNPSVHQIHINIGNCHLQEKHYPEAVAAYTRYLDSVRSESSSLKGHKMAAQVLASIGRAYLEQDRIDAAVDAFKQAIDAFPGDAVLAYNVGEVLFNKGRAEEAVPYLEIATRIDPEWPLPFLKLGYAQLNLGRYAPARASFHSFLALAPEDSQAESIQGLLKSLDDLIKKES